MGLDASVMCNCFRDGKTTVPPVSPGWLEVDQEGNLSLKAAFYSNDLYLKVTDWQQSCCDHEGMCIASEHIASWSAYRLFQEALTDLGLERFPVLRRDLPNTNEGLMDAAAARLALAELDLFLEAGAIGKTAVLVDSRTDEALYERVAAYDGIFIQSDDHGVSVGLSQTELFVRDAATGEDIFSSRRLRLLKTDGTGTLIDDDGVVWEDMDTGRRYQAGFAIPGKIVPWDDGRWQDAAGKFRRDYPAELHVETRIRTVEDFDHIVHALKSVFSASVESGNPVRWC